MDKKQALRVVMDAATIYADMMRDDLVDGPEGCEVSLRDEYDELMKALEVLNG